MPQAVDHYSTRMGAQELAQKLDAFWHRQGYPNVKHWIEAERWSVSTRRKYRAGNLTDVKYHLWVVRSNLINGQPPKP